MNGLLEAVTDFIFPEDEPRKADLILVCGSARLEPAKRGAKLFQEGYAPYIMPTGRFGERYRDFRDEMERVARNDGRLPEEVFAEIEADAKKVGMPFPSTEWEYQRNELLLHGVPESAILREDESVNTFQNAINARKVLEREKISVSSLILCCQAFHSRRAGMTIASEFTDVRIILCPAKTRGIGRDSWYKTQTGYDKVLEELSKCGQYFSGERMYLAAMENEPASGVKDPHKDLK